MRSRVVPIAVMTAMLIATGLVAPTPMDAQATSLTARQVLERIKSNIGVP